MENPPSNLEGTRFSVQVPIADESVVSELLRVQATLEADGVEFKKKIEANHFHFTLRFFGKPGKDFLEEALQTIQTILAESIPRIFENQEPTNLESDGLELLYSADGTPNVWVVKIEKSELLKKLHESLQGIEIGKKRERIGWEPHITLGAVDQTKNPINTKVREFSTNIEQVILSGSRDGIKTQFSQFTPQ